MRAIPVVVGLTAIVGLVDAAGAPGAARNKLFVEGDVVRGAQQGAPGPFCVLSNQFKRLEKVVWRIRVLDEAKSLYWLWKLAAKEGERQDPKQAREWYEYLMDAKYKDTEFQALASKEPKPGE